MKLEKLLSEQSSTILKRWLQLILETYPSDTQRFLKKQKDQFANPVRDTISKETKNIYRELLQGIDREKVSPSLDRIIRIRAVQDFSPSQAIFFIFLLKKVVREVLEKEIRENRLADELLIFESKIDDLAFIAFDIYMKCREKMYELRAKEARNQVSKLLQRAGLMAEIPEWEPSLKEGNDL
ncbi:MAG: RsbRD N-terminal domain-containing protein [Deltaproteobacteria bacterium]|nr:MAG: RsbRD N-terminal domain-containing protein [Deltaproteobacteria bacterium]